MSSQKQAVLLKGINKLMRDANAKIKLMGEATTKGLIESAILVRRDMDKTSPKVPVDTRNLDASFFIVSSAGNVVGKSDEAKSLISGGKAKVALGFSANYAVVVHEDTETKKNWNRPGSGPKFLEAALFRNKEEILKTIAKSIKV